PAQRLHPRREGVHRRPVGPRSRPPIGAPVERLRARSGSSMNRARLRLLARPLAAAAGIGIAGWAWPAEPQVKDAPRAAQDARAAALPSLVVRGGTVYVPGDHPPMAEGTIIVTSDRIKTVVAGMAPPTGVPSIDARGKVVTAGFIDASAQL